MSENNNEKNVVGKRIRALRNTQSLSQLQVVERINQSGHSMTPSTLSKIEKMKRRVSDIELIVFAEIFDVGIEHLFKNDA